jgi:hypothetical protein
MRRQLLFDSHCQLECNIMIIFQFNLKFQLHGWVSFFTWERLRKCERLQSLSFSFTFFHSSDLDLTFLWGY